MKSLSLVQWEARKKVFAELLLDLVWEDSSVTHRAIFCDMYFLLIVLVYTDLQIKEKTARYISFVHW